MYSTTKTLTLLEQKRIQWAKEREEMVGLCGLWGHQKNFKAEKLMGKNEEMPETPRRRSSLLPPIPLKNTPEETIKEEYTCRPEEESETSGYLSDSPQHTHEKDTSQGNRYGQGSNGNVSQNEQWEGGRDEASQQAYWCDPNVERNNENYWAEKKMYKNYKNEKWAQMSTDSWTHQSPRQGKNSWYGTPESISSDDGSRPRWGDRGVGVGHLWEPVVHQPESRLPQVTEPYRQTPKWVERGLRHAENGKADILVIHHPDEESDRYKTDNKNENNAQKNFLLGQNVPLPPEIIEERERKRKKALEHQNAIRKQLEERENKRREEREARIREERLEEERIKREQDIERQRYEEEQRKTKEKEEKEKRKEEAMKEALELAEKLAKEEKKQTRKQVQIEEDSYNKKGSERNEPVKERRFTPRPQKSKSLDESYRNKAETPKRKRREVETSPRQNDRSLKDVSSQFEEIRPANGVHFLNMNGLPPEGGLALVLDQPPAENNLLLPGDGVQLALLMSPGNVNHGQLIPLPTPSSNASIQTNGRVLTPSKYRISERSDRSFLEDKSTQTDRSCCSAARKLSRSCSRGRKYSRRSGRTSGHSDSSEKSNSLERSYAHYNCTLSSRQRSRSQPKLAIDDRPKWGINRPSVQYKKQSEKDPYYQRKVRQRQKKTIDIGTLTESHSKLTEVVPVKENLLESEIRMLRCETDDEDLLVTTKRSEKDDFILKNGYRMNSNPSSPLFVPIETPRNDVESSQQVETKKVGQPLELENLIDVKDNPEDEETEMLGAVSCLTLQELDTIREIASLRKGLEKIQTQLATSRSLTPLSANSEKSEQNLSSDPVATPT